MSQILDGLKIGAALGAGVGGFILALGVCIILLIALLAVVTGRL